MSDLVKRDSFTRNAQKFSIKRQEKKSEHFKRMVDKRLKRSTPTNLEKLYLNLLKKQVTIEKIIATILNPKTDPKERAELFNLCNLYTMSGMIEGMMVLGTALTERHPHDKIKKRVKAEVNGDPNHPDCFETKPGFVRISHPEETTDLLFDVIALTEEIHEMIHDIGVGEGHLGRDEHNVPQKTSYEESREQAEKDAEEAANQALTEDEAVVAGEEDLPEASPEDIDKLLNERLNEVNSK